jgi:hypothetical protein
LVEPVAKYAMAYLTKTTYMYLLEGSVSRFSIEPSKSDI